MSFFASAARILVKHIGNAAGLGVGGDIAIDLWDLWNSSTPDEQQKLKEMQEIASRSDVETRRDAQKAAMEVASDNPELQKRIQTVLTQIPAAVRGWQRIGNKAIELLANRPKGVRYTELVREIHAAYPEIALGTIRATIPKLPSLFPADICKPARGLFIAVKFDKPETPARVKVEVLSQNLEEKADETGRQRIGNKAIELLANRPEGIRYAELVRELHAGCPEIASGTIRATVPKLASLFAVDICKPALGIFRAVKFGKPEIPAPDETIPFAELDEPGWTTGGGRARA